MSTVGEVNPLTDDPWALDVDAPVNADSSRYEGEELTQVESEAPPAVNLPRIGVGEDTSALNPQQRKVLDEVLEMGGNRPVTPVGLSEELRTQIHETVASSMNLWSEPSLWVSKSSLVTVHRCEGNYVADAAQPRSGLTAPIVVGQISHRGIQVSHTHPGRPVEEYVRAAIQSQLASDENFSRYWSAADIATQSDVITSATSKVTAFLDSWPPLLPEWTPRFEDGVSAKVAGATFSARPDLTLGRPRADLRQSMVLVDFKTGSLRDEHRMEALYYALVHTLRYDVAPFKSVVYSLSSGEWVAPIVEFETLRECAEWVSTGVSKMVESRSQIRELVLTPSRACSWCPAARDCPVSEAS